MSAKYDELKAQLLEDHKAHENMTNTFHIIATINGYDAKAIQDKGASLSDMFEHALNSKTVEELAARATEIQKQQEIFCGEYMTLATAMETDAMLDKLDKAPAPKFWN